jgi:hypothetical protein
MFCGWSYPRYCCSLFSMLGFTVFWFLVVFRFCCSCNDLVLGCVDSEDLPEKAVPLENVCSFRHIVKNWSSENILLVSRSDRRSILRLTGSHIFRVRLSGRDWLHFIRIQLCGLLEYLSLNTGLDITVQRNGGPLYRVYTKEWCGFKS